MPIANGTHIGACPNADVVLIDLPKPGAGAPGPASR